MRLKLHLVEGPRRAQQRQHDIKENPEFAGAIDPRELEAQRALKWRPIYRWSALTRAPGDGSWGAKAPAGKEANWIATASGKGLFVIFRLYGPLEPWYDRSWRLGEPEQVK